MPGHLSVMSSSRHIKHPSRLASKFPRETEGRGKPLSPKQCKAAIRIMKDAEQGGFEFSNTNHI